MKPFDYTLIAFCALGAEKICSNEIRKLNEVSGSYQILESRWGQIVFQTDLRGIYRALCALRTADRLLLRCASFRASNFDELFEGVRKIELEALVPRNAGLFVSKVRSKASQLKAQTAIQSLVHKAAAERLCTAWGLQRLDDNAPQKIELRVFLEKNQADILLDICGKPLFKRGYREGSGGIAPLRETSAAALLFSAGWRRKYPLYDPFCGSGTIAVEAALFACNLAPNLTRHFAFDHLLPADTDSAASVREELRAAADFSKPFSIIGSDTDSGLISLAQKNLSAAFDGFTVSTPPVFHKLPMENAKTFTDVPGIIITNPPYGKRLGSLNEAEEGYAKMAVLRKNFPGWKIIVISDHSGFESFFGQKADACATLTYGVSNTYIYQFEKPDAPPPPRAEKPNYERRGARKPPESAPASSPQKNRPPPKKNYTW
ncbi:MAG: class I SAM-dependent RNA methyltransferase [Spirochaetaceae bacterium]|jgi:putative N6-adenine-specific DNA methylase|nr:class I SAM-dependent RNA methyltransferase [Spirochaetaceae bacterium]